MTDTTVIEPNQAARDRHNHRAGAIVVGFGRCASSASAVASAAQLGKQLKAEIVVVHALDLADYPVDPDGWGWEKQHEQKIATHREVVATLLANYEHGWSYDLVRGEPVEALISTAEEVQAVMIVVGSHREGRIRRLLAEAVADRLIRATGRPVLVVRGPTPS